MEAKKIETQEDLSETVATGFALDGTMVKNMKDKKFTVVGTRVDKFPDFKEPTKTVNRIAVIVKIADGTIVDYYPNKTSQKLIIAQKGFVYANWVGFSGEFEVLSQRIGENVKDVIYIKK